MAKEIKTVGIIGEGKMGTNLFYYLLDFGFSVIWICSREADTDKLAKSFSRRIKRSLDTGIIDEKTYTFLQNYIVITKDIRQTEPCDLIIEAVPEDLHMKRKLFEELDTLAGTECIFVSNSSSYKPSELFASIFRKDRAAGLHFFYPVALKNIVEFIVPETITEDTIQKIRIFLEMIHRDHLFLKEEQAFVLNKIFLDFQNEAFIIVSEGSLTVQQMDLLIKKYIIPAGVFDFCDSVGNDIMLTSVNNYIRDYGNRDHYLLFAGELERLVKAKRMGQKTEAGFYTYPVDSGHDELMINDLNKELIDRVIAKLTSTLAGSIAKFAVQSGIQKQILNKAMKEYLGCDNDLLNPGE